MSKLILVLLVILPSMVWAQQHCNGDEFAGLVPPPIGTRLANGIEYNPRPTEPYEYQKYGKVIKGPKDFKNLKDGAYLYVIDEEGNLAISPRFPNYLGEKILVTHPALVEILAQEGGKKTRVAAAGEFFIDGQVVSEFSNKSGRFRGKTEHLDYALDELRKRGLEVPIGVKLKDFSFRKYDPNHKIEKDVAKSVIKYFQKEPRLAQEFDDFVSNYQKIFSHPENRSDIPGQLNYKKLAKEYMVFRLSHPEQSEAADLVTFMLGNVYGEGQRHFHPYLNVLESATASNRKAALELIRKIAETGSFPK